MMRKEERISYEEKRSLGKVDVEETIKKITFKKMDGCDITERLAKAGKRLFIIKD